MASGSSSLVSGPKIRGNPFVSLRQTASRCLVKVHHGLGPPRMPVGSNNTPENAAHAVPFWRSPYLETLNGGVPGPAGTGSLGRVARIPSRLNLTIGGPSNRGSWMVTEGSPN